MYRLCDKNRGRNTEVRLARDQSSTPKICRRPNSFEDRRESDKALDVRVRKFVFACSNRRSTGSSQGRSQELDMFFLIMDDVFEVTVILRSVSSGNEILFGEFFKSSLVEYIFKVFKLASGLTSVFSSATTSEYGRKTNRQRKLQDIGISDGLTFRLGNRCWCCEGRRCEKEHSS